MSNFATKLAHSILELEDEIARLRHENARLQGYKQRYDELLDSTTEHSANMSFGLLQLGLKMYEQKKD